MNPRGEAGAARTFRVWDLPLRLFHWLLVAAVAAAFLSAFESSPIAPWHQAAGWAAAVLIAFRVVWGFVGGANARFGALRFDRLGEHLAELLKGKAEPTVGHNPLGGLSILALLSLTALTIGTGAALRGGEGGVHSVLAYALLALVGVHVAAVVVMSRLTGENLVRSMITGRKPAALHPTAVNAPEPGIAALLIAAATVIAAVCLAFQVDPLAFTSHPASDHGERSSAADAG